MAARISDFNQILIGDSQLVGKLDNVVVIPQLNSVVRKYVCTGYRM